MTKVTIQAGRTKLDDVAVGSDGDSGIEFVYEIIAQRLALIDTGFHIAGHLVLYGPHHFYELESGKT